MQKSTQGKSVLVELLVAVMIFALASTVVLGLFIKGRAYAERSDALSRAVIVAQSYAERAMSGELRLDDTRTIEEADLLVTISSHVEGGDLGSYISGQVSVAQSGETLITLPFGKYEAAP